MEQKENREEFRQLSRQETAAVPSPLAAPPPPSSFPFFSFDFEKKTTTSLISLLGLGGRETRDSFLPCRRNPNTTPLRVLFVSLAHVEYCRHAILIFVSTWTTWSHPALTSYYHGLPSTGPQIMAQYRMLTLIFFISVGTLPFQDFSICGPIYLSFFSFLFYCTSNYHLHCKLLTYSVFKKKLIQ